MSGVLVSISISRIRSYGHNIIDALTFVAGTVPWALAIKHRYQQSHREAKPLFIKKNPDSSAVYYLLLLKGRPGV